MLSPRSSLDINGNLKFASDARLAVQFRTVGNMGVFDMIDVSGTVTLGGTLDVSILGVSGPKPGVMYTMLTAGGINGSFDQIVGLATANGSWVPQFGGSLTSINFSHTQTRGDMNGDQIVNHSDVEKFAWAIRDANSYFEEFVLGAFAADASIADMDLDGQNTFADIPAFLEAVEQSGENPQMALAGIVSVLQSVPEPCSTNLVAGLLALLAHRARRSPGRERATK
jgi:hypothetical protein